MALISHRWPFITPFTLGPPMTLQWWAYYVHAAKQIIEAQREANRGRG